MQAVAFSGVWIGRKWVFWGAPGWVPAELGWLAPALCVLSVAMAAWSIWTLGRNWSVAARVAESHELITTGPYRVVRHPIYTAMFGVLIAMGLSLSTPAATLAASAVFVIGTSIRVWFEERLLRGYFGEEFARYRETVPAFIPFLRLRKGAPEQL